MVQFLSIIFFSWISSIFVGFFKSSLFCVTLYIDSQPEANAPIGKTNRTQLAAARQPSTFSFLFYFILFFLFPIVAKHYM